jgi:hypothetical protein
MTEGSSILTRAIVEEKQTALQAEIARLEKQTEEKREELKKYHWVVDTFFFKLPRIRMKRTAKEMAEQVLLEAKKPLAPREIHIGIQRLGYEGKPGNIYPRLHKWMRMGNTSIVKVNEGLYAHKSVALVLSQDASRPL